MNLQCKFLLLLIPLLLLPGVVKAEDKTLTGEWKEIESGISTVKLEEKGEFIAQLEEKIKALTLAPHEEGTVFDYSYSIMQEYQEETKSYSKVDVDKTFSTLDEAKQYYEDLEVEGKTNPKYTELFSDEFELVCDSDCEKEIPSDYVCEVNETEYKTVEKTFETKEEMDAYEPETIEGFKYVGMEDKSEKFCTPVYLKDLYKTVYDNKQDAETALNEFISKYGGTYTEPKQIENTPVEYYDETDLYYDEALVDKKDIDIKTDLKNHI